MIYTQLYTDIQMHDDVCDSATSPQKHPWGLLRMLLAVLSPLRGLSARRATTHFEALLHFHEAHTYLPGML